MSNRFDDFRAAVLEAETTIKAADEGANTMARLLSGRLRHVNRYRLVDLKRELREFDAHRKEWKS